MLQYDNRIRRAAQISPLKLRRVCLDPPWRSAQFVNFYSTGKKEERKPKGEKKKIYEREEGRKMTIVCLRMETDTPEIPHALHACAW